MANMPDINKRYLTALLPLDLVAKIKKESKRRGMSSTELITWILERSLESVVLSSNDFLWIASEVKKNEEKRRIHK